MNNSMETVDVECSETNAYDVESYLNFKGKNIKSSTCDMKLYQINKNWYITPTIPLLATN